MLDQQKQLLEVIELVPSNKKLLKQAIVLDYMMLEFDYSKYYEDYIAVIETLITNLIIDVPTEILSVLDILEKGENISYSYACLLLDTETNRGDMIDLLAILTDDLSVENNFTIILDK